MNISADNFFEIVNTIILPAWLMLMFAPKWRWTKKIVLSGYYPLAFAVIYLFIILLNFQLSNFNFSSLQSVKQIFTDDFFLLAGWVHYLAFDLLIGSWIVKDASKYHIKSITLLPILGFTFYLGPIGYLTYRVYRALRQAYHQQDKSEFS